jgi:hypothetical protein
MKKKVTKPKQRSKQQSATPRANPSEVTSPSRDIRRPVESMLWGRSAGRCEFDGCNRILSRSSVTQEQANIAQKAHIWAFSAGGPRGHAGITDEELNEVENLMLVCHECHTKIDQAQGSKKYTAGMLRSWKEEHEKRIEIATGIAPERRSHVLVYGTNVGDHGSPFTFNETAGAMFPDRRPTEPRPVILGTANNSLQDKSPEFWRVESAHLRKHFDQRVRERIAGGELHHLSVFALAPQPLLILLGDLLGDITSADVYQRHREPPSWTWPTGGVAQPFEVTEPPTTEGQPALLLSLSATVTHDRLTAVLGPKASVWRVSVPQPGNDFVKSRDQLSEFRKLMRPLLDRIKAAHGQTTLLNIFPVAPVSLAIELGRVRMPKAEMPWRIYDQVNHQGGFVHALDLPLGEHT